MGASALKDKEGEEPVFIKKWKKTKQAQLFCLSNSLVQVYFRDKTELFVWMDTNGTKMVTFIDTLQMVTTMPSADAAKSKDKELIQRLKFTRTLLKSKDDQPDVAATQDLKLKLMQAEDVDLAAGAE